MPPSLPGGALAPWPEHNPEQARELLKAAGYCNGRPLRFPLTFRSNVPADKLLALTWQAQVQRDLSDCLVLDLDGVESTTIYDYSSECNSMTTEKFSNRMHHYVSTQVNRLH